MAVKNLVIYADVKNVHLPQGQKAPKMDIPLQKQS